MLTVWPQGPAKPDAKGDAASEKRIASLKEGNKELQEELSMSQRMVSSGPCATRVCEARVLPVCARPVCEARVRGPCRR